MSESGCSLKKSSSSAARWWERLLLAAAFATCLRLLPPWWCGQGAGEWWRGETSRQAALADGVARWTAAPLGPGEFKTGVGTFDGEWLFGTYQMAVLGHAQIGRQQPELLQASLRRMEDAEDRMLAENVRAFDRREWKEDPLAALQGSNGHAGYLGYLNVALGVHRRLDPQLKHRDLNDRITAALARNLAASPISLIETYPGQTFPVDNCAVAVSLRLHDLADRTNRYEAVYRRWLGMMRERYADPQSGLLFQAVEGRSGRPLDAPRGSGTLLGAYFLGLVGDPLARELYLAARRELWAPLMGFGAALEYPAEFAGGRGDIDSGPLVLGRSVSATGLMLGCARQQEDETAFREIFRTVHLFGAPTRQAGRLTFALGGPLGDAMMLALLTAQPEAAR